MYVFILTCCLFSAVGNKTRKREGNRKRLLFSQTDPMGFVSITVVLDRYYSINANESNACSLPHFNSRSTPNISMKLD